MTKTNASAVDGFPSKIGRSAAVDGVAVDQAGPASLDSDEDRALLRVVAWRVLPLAGLVYLVAVVDRSTIGFAKLQMVSDLHLTEVAFGLGSSLFFIGSVFFEIPSAIGLTRWGPRRWLSRILITWSLVTIATGFCTSATVFYGLRFLLGVAEAGAYPGVIYYLSRWFPQSRRVWAVGLITLGSPIGNSLAAISGGLLLSADGYWGIAGWQWIFLVTGAVSAALGIGLLLFLPNGPMDASFLSPRGKARLTDMIQAEAGPPRHDTGSVWRTLFNLDVAVYSLLFAAILTSSYGVVYWLPTVVKSLGASSAQNGFINAMPWGLSTLMLILVPPLLQNERSVFRAMIVASAAGLVCFGFSTILTDNWQRFVAMMIAMPCMSLLPPAFWWLPSRAFAGERSASAFAAITTVGTMGGFFAQSLMPLAARLTGESIGAMLVPAMCNALVLLALICLQWRVA
jgi:MFS family permease